MDRLIIFCFLSSLLAQASAASCSLTNRVSNFQQCLADIKTAASNDSAFWFGTQYASFCPHGNPDPNEFECFQPSNASNMFSRMFSPSFVPSSLDRFLTMEFTSPPGTYTGCGNSYTTNTTWKSDIDPLSSLVVKPWQVRFLPYLQWATLPGEMFTLVVYDVGYLITHAIYTNVRGNDFSLSDVTLKYNGPGNPGPRENIYVFMIFRQSGHVTVPASWQTKMQRRINFTDLVTDWHLRGPIAINWLKVVGDVYAVQNAVNNHILNMCPFVEEMELNKMSLPSYLPKPVHLNVGITVTYHSNAIDFTACCSTHKYSQETFALNPLRNPVYNTYKVSQKPTVTLLKKGVYPGITNLTGDIYTLMMVDANIVNPVVGNATHPLIFWLVTNIRDGNVSTAPNIKINGVFNISQGQEYVSYLGPLPRNGSPHTYYYLLYKQQAALPVSTFYSYTNHCANPLGRCLFNIDGLVADKNLQLVGVTWLRATTDIYVAFQRIYTAGLSMSQWCTGMQGYNGDPSCPTGLSTVVHPGVIVG